MQRVVKRTEKRHLLNCHIAGFGYWDGAEAFDRLRIGTELDLVREEDNKFDPYAVAVWYGDYKLGFIPREDNKVLSKFLDMEYEEIFEARVARISPEEHPENQVEIVIHIKENMFFAPPRNIE